MQCSHKAYINNTFFEIKFSGYIMLYNKYSWHVSSIVAPYCHQLVFLKQECSWSHSKLNTKIFWRFWQLLLSCLLFHRDHEKSGKSATSFIQKFKQTQTILRVSKDFGDKLCISVIFNDVTFITAHLFESGSTLI